MKINFCYHGHSMLSLDTTGRVLWWVGDQIVSYCVLYCIGFVYCIINALKYLFRLVFGGFSEQIWLSFVR